MKDFAWLAAYALLLRDRSMAYTKIGLQREVKRFWGGITSRFLYSTIMRTHSTTMADMEINIQMTNKHDKRCSLQKAMRTFAWFQHSSHDVKGFSNCCCSGSAACRGESACCIVPACGNRMLVSGVAWDSSSLSLIHIIGIIFDWVLFAVAYESVWPATLVCPTVTQFHITIHTPSQHSESTLWTCKSRPQSTDTLRLPRLNSEASENKKIMIIKTCMNTQHNTNLVTYKSQTDCASVHYSEERKTVT